jgi:hypothetical protein
MPVVQKKSTWAPPGGGVARLLLEASRRAEAMGLIEPHAGPNARPHPGSPGDLAVFRHIARQAGKAGIATATAAALHNVEAPTSEELTGLLKTMIAALEASPASGRPPIRSPRGSTFSRSSSATSLARTMTSASAAGSSASGRCSTAARPLNC